MSENKFYDGTKLLSLKDLNGRTPEIFICETNRTGGKTVWFSNYVVKDFLKKDKKFMLIYRFKYELDEVADTFFKDIGKLFYNGYHMTSKSMATGIYHELYINEKPCGYAVSLNSADQIKKKAHLFSDTECMLFDEFQSETDHYCADEVSKLISIHTSVARGQGKQVRYVPIYMLSNSVSLLNPYYAELDISSRLRDDTKFLRGDGFVMERGFINSASQAQLESGFNRAFKKNSYIKYSAENVYLNDNKAFVEKPSGTGRYLATLIYKGGMYGIREFADAGVIYCDDKADKTFPAKIAVTTADHNINYVMLKRNSLFLTNMRYYFEQGCFRFKDLRCKEVILKALAYY